MLTSDERSSDYSCKALITNYIKGEDRTGKGITSEQDIQNIYPLLKLRYLFNYSTKIIIIKKKNKPNRKIRRIKILLA